jgi:hypothetical protein
MFYTEKEHYYRKYAYCTTFTFFMPTGRESNKLDPDKTPGFVESDLEPSCLRLFSWPRSAQKKCWKIKETCQPENNKTKRAIFES